MLSITLIYWCLAKYICAGLQAQFFKKSFNHKMIAVKQTNKITHIEGSVFWAEWNDCNTVICQLGMFTDFCQLKDCKNGQESENEETLLSGSRRRLKSCLKLFWSCSAEKHLLLKVSWNTCGGF